MSRPRLTKVPRWRSALFRLRKKGVPVRELSRMSGIPRRTLRDLFSGKTRKPSARTKSKLTRAGIKVFDYEPVWYETDCHVRLDDEVSPEGWVNQSRWEDLFRSLQQPSPANFHHATYTVVFDVYDKNDNILAKDQHSKCYADSARFAILKWNELLFTVLGHVKANIGIRLSAGEGYVVITQVQLAFYPKPKVR